MTIIRANFDLDNLPKVKKKPSEPRKYPFKDLEPGQGFWVPNRKIVGDVENASTLQNMQTHCWRYSRKDQRTYSCKVSEQNPSWLQVWREA